MWNILFGLSVWALRNGPVLVWALLCLQPPKYREKHAYNYHITMFTSQKARQHKGHSPKDDNVLWKKKDFYWNLLNITFKSRGVKTQICKTAGWFWTQVLCSHASEFFHARGCSFDFFYNYVLKTATCLFKKKKKFQQISFWAEEQQAHIRHRQFCF